MTFEVESVGAQSVLSPAYHGENTRVKRKKGGCTNSVCVRDSGEAERERERRERRMRSQHLLSEARGTCWKKRSSHLFLLSHHPAVAYFSSGFSFFTSKKGKSERSSFRPFPERWHVPSREENVVIFFFILENRQTFVIMIVTFFFMCIANGQAEPGGPSGVSLGTVRSAAVFLLRGMQVEEPPFLLLCLPCFFFKEKKNNYLPFRFFFLNTKPSLD